MTLRRNGPSNGPNSSSKSPAVRTAFIFFQRFWKCCILLVKRRQECSLNAAQALGYKISEQTQLLRKLHKEQSSGFCLLRTLAKTLGPYFLTGTLCLLIQDAFMFSIPQVLRWERETYRMWFIWLWNAKTFMDFKVCLDTFLGPLHVEVWTTWWQIYDKITPCHTRLKKEDHSLKKRL